MKPSQNIRSHGVALVIVLSFLILISILIVGFFSSVSTELANSKAVAVSASTHQLADSAVNVAMAQLVDATKAQDSSNATLAWASQPGMIRTFDSTGQAKDFFKLYSSDQMTMSGTGFDSAAELPPADWNAATNSELYTDLNAPGTDSLGLLVYPIVDPSADGTAAPGRVDDKFKVDGFSITPPKSYDGSKPESGVNNRAPMPVKWLYVLKDGSLKAASKPGAGNVSVTGATTDNPIVGRIAFWTDDETAKVNINTASEGVYWDIPRIFSPEDVGLAAGYTPGAVASTPGLGLCQPANHEFQRYPGHPATTSLSPVFGSLLASPVPSLANNYTAILPANAAQLDSYYNIAPRIGMVATGAGVAQGGGGSNGGTRIPTTINLDSDRLYASVDEFMFSPALTTAGTPPSRVPNTATNTKNPNTITKGILEKARFFITANSNAPEVTLYNTPRIGIWPVNVDPAKQTAFDKLAAFCGTVGNNPGASEYYFTRQNARSSTDDYDKIPRNQTLYKYLQALTSKAVPGFGGKFSDKYPAGANGVTDCDQILTSIFDYVRCVNLSDTSSGAKPFTPLTNFDDKIPLSTTAGAGEVIPIRINKTQGFGRFDTVAELDLLFYGTHKFATKNMADKMKAVVIMKFGSPMQGNVGYQPNLKYRITGLDTLKITDAKPAPT